jgi:hypothetical protein
MKTNSLFRIMFVTVLFTVPACGDSAKGGGSGGHATDGGAGAGAGGDGGGTGGALNCGPGCINLCQGGLCDCWCEGTAGVGGAAQDRRCGSSQCAVGNYCSIQYPGIGAAPSYACTDLGNCTDCPCLNSGACTCTQAANGFITVACASP